MKNETDAIETNRAVLRCNGRIWREEAGIICFPVTSDGTTGPEWSVRLENKSYLVSPNAKSMLFSRRFKPTNDVQSNVAVLRGMLFQDNYRTMGRIIAQSELRKLRTLNAEVACLICEMFTNAEIKNMGLARIIAMHVPLNDMNGLPHLLCVGHMADKHSLYERSGGSGDLHDRDSGFAFAAPQPRSEN
ncbi:MAG TPA: hypothetical protein VJJ02_01890 [Candidatus Paceibacterota bacterium]